MAQIELGCESTRYRIVVETDPQFPSTHGFKLNSFGSATLISNNNYGIQLKEFSWNIPTAPSIGYTSLEAYSDCDNSNGEWIQDADWVAEISIKKDGEEEKRFNDRFDFNRKSSTIGQTVSGLSDGDIIEVEIFAVYRGSGEEVDGGESIPGLSKKTTITDVVDKYKRIESIPGFRLMHEYEDPDKAFGNKIRKFGESLFITDDEFAIGHPAKYIPEDTVASKGDACVYLYNLETGAMKKRFVAPSSSLRYNGTSNHGERFGSLIAPSAGDGNKLIVIDPAVSAYGYYGVQYKMYDNGAGYGLMYMYSNDNQLKIDGNKKLQGYTFGPNSHSYAIGIRTDDRSYTITDSLNPLPKDIYVTNNFVTTLLKKKINGIYTYIIQVRHKDNVFSQYEYAIHDTTQSEYVILVVRSSSDDVIYVLYYNGNDYSKKIKKITLGKYLNEIKEQSFDFTITVPEDSTFHSGYSFDIEKRIVAENENYIYIVENGWDSLSDEDNSMISVFDKYSNKVIGYFMIGVGQHVTAMEAFGNKLIISYQPEAYLDVVGSGSGSGSGSYSGSGRFAIISGSGSGSGSGTQEPEMVCDYGRSCYGKVAVFETGHTEMFESFEPCKSPQKDDLINRINR